jgi:replicative DNA helicase
VFNEFTDLKSSLLDAIEHRSQMRAESFRFGIDYLDDALHGIFKNDLVLVGALSGRGKTQFAVNLAINVAKQNKKVFYFALEADRFEIQRRVMFSKLPKGLITNEEYMTGYTSDVINEEERRVAENMDALESFSVYYKSGEFGSKEVQRYLLSLQNEADLFIVDHFHYLDSSQAYDEKSEHKEAIRVIRDTAISANKPVVLLAHMNKAAASVDIKVPDLRDFYGTSDLCNIATKVITISPRVPEHVTASATNSVPTLIYTAKHRHAGSTARYVGACSFSFDTGTYNPNYLLLHHDSLEFVEDRKIPSWAKRSIPSKPYYLNQEID